MLNENGFLHTFRGHSKRTNQGCQPPGHAGSQILYKMRPNFTKRGQNLIFIQLSPPPLPPVVDQMTKSPETEFCHENYE